jgi:hypothetical protein
MWINLHVLFWICLFGLSFLSVIHCDSKYSGIVIQSVDRTIDLTSQLARHTTKITFQNEANPPTPNFYLWVEEKMSQKLSFIQVTVDSSGTLLTVTPETNPVQAAGLRYR